jgi:protein-tyrosine phosphatase
LARCSHQKVEKNNVSTLRRLALPKGVPGEVLLTAMPGSQGDFSTRRDAIEAAGVDAVLCLTPLAEIEKKSTAYAEAIKSHQLPWKQMMLPMPDFDVADDRDAWLAHIREVAHQLQEGQTVLIHCAAGIGRTGTAAICLLMSLGERHDAALRAVKAAGSDPEAVPQQELIAWVAEVLGKK